MADTFLALLEREKPQIMAMLPSYIGPDRWYALAYEVSRSKALQEVAEKNPNSLLAALKKIADWGLELDGEECVIVPYWDAENKVPVAEAQAMYKGMIRRAVEAEVCVHLYSDLIRDGDDVEEISGSHRELKVKHKRFSNKPIIGAYAVAYLANGLTDYEIFDVKDIAAVKAAALRMAQRRKKDASESPAWRFFEGQMIKKSVLRRLCQRLRGKRTTDAGRRYSEMVARDTQYDVETTSESVPDDLPPPKAVVVQDVDGVGRVEGSHAGSENASTQKGPPLSSHAASRSGGADDSLIGLEEQQSIIDWYKSHHPKKWLGILSQSLYDFGQIEDVSELKTSQLSAFLAHSEKFA